MEPLLYVCGIFCILYYIRIISHAGIRAAFAPIWILFAIVCMGSGFLLKFQFLEKLWIPIWIQILGCSIVVFGILVFCIVEGILIYYGHVKPKQQADYMIVLGAKVNGRIPSKTLQRRVEKSALYLQENKKTKVIVSGGMGRGERVTEAFAMKQLLVQRGISSDRIIMEEKSVNTDQNIRFSKSFIKEQSQKSMEQLELVIATSDFHIFRGISLAKKQGFKKVSGCPSKSDCILAIHYYVREFFAVVKDKLMNHI